MNQIYALINTQKTNKKGDDNIVLLFLLVLILVLVRWRTARLSFPLDEFLETAFINSIKIWRVQGFLHFFSLWGTYNHTHLFPKGNSIILQRQFTQAFLSHPIWDQLSCFLQLCFYWHCLLIWLYLAPNPVILSTYFSLYDFLLSYLLSFVLIISPRRIHPLQSSQIFFCFGVVTPMCKTSSLHAYDCGKKMKITNKWKFWANWWCNAVIIFMHTS